MSFQPSLNRPPFTMPPLPPGIPPPAFTAFPPMPPGTQMMGSTMGMPMSMLPQTTVATAAASSTSSLGRPSLMDRKNEPPLLDTRRRPFGRKPDMSRGMSSSSVASTYKKSDGRENSDRGESNKDKTTVFVGNISERASDVMIRQLLSKCGLMTSWKRVQGASGKLQAFGFCEYADPEASLRAIRLLHERPIGEKNLVVKVDAKTRERLDDYLAKKKGHDDSKDDVDQDNAKKDRILKLQLENILKEHSAELNRSFPDEDGEGGRRGKKKLEKEKKEDEKIDDMEMDEDKKNLISREIRVFRDSHKGEEDKEKEKEKERERERDRRDRERKERERMLEKSRDREREKKRDREKDSERRERDREREREEREREREEEEEMYERRKLERKLREKEAAYRELLKSWESRERKKRREYEKERDKDEERKEEQEREGKRLKEFLEDYDDEKDDPKFYKGTAFQRRLRDREKEIDDDNRDRKKEKEELEEIRRKLMEEGHPDPEAEIQKLERERESHKQPQIKKEPTPKREIVEPKPKLEPTLKPTYTPIQVSATPPTPASSLEPEDDEGGIPEGPEFKPKLGFSGLKLGANNSPQQGSNKRKMTLSEVFNANEEDGRDDASKKRKLIPLDYTEEEMKAVRPSQSVVTAAEEKRKHIKSLIEKIPTAKEELFAYELNWSMVDENLMERRVKPWINKKIVEYIGEEEPTLVDFICQKVMARSSPQDILNDVTMVLDEEAEVFVVKMWRLLIYETEAKKIGLVK
ncbi:RNA-binding protein 25-like [Glandiceps talaboti]